MNVEQEHPVRIIYRLQKCMIYSSNADVNTGESCSERLSCLVTGLFCGCGGVRFDLEYIL